MTPLLLALACSSNQNLAVGPHMAVSGGHDANGAMVATVHAESQLLLAAVYADGFVVLHDEVPDTWTLGQPVPEGMASTTVLDPGGELELAHPAPGEAVVAFRDDAEYVYYCFTDADGSICQLE